jgi:D-3-phosphoglycerate dehydrogenase
MKLKTLIIDELSEYFDNLVIERGLSDYFYRDIPNPDDIGIIIVKTFTKVDSALLKKYPRLKMIIRAGTGYDNIDLEEAGKRGVVVCNTPEANVMAAFEQTLSFVFALLKQHQLGKANLQKRRWKEGHCLNLEIGDLKALIVGVGRIGSRVARFLREFGAEVYGVDPYLTTDEWREREAHHVNYQEGLKLCNLITYHCPLKAETEDYFSEATLKQLTHPVWLINTARGGIVNEQALLKGLKEGMILGAGLDVFEDEPDPQIPFGDFDNVYMTPHTGAYTAAARRRMAVELLKVWEAFIFHQRVINEVK